MGMAYDRDRKKMVIFGGNKLDIGQTPPRFDVAPGFTWESTNGNAFSVLASSGPTRRGGPAMGYDEKRKVTVLFGGRLCKEDAPFLCFSGAPEEVDFNDTWEWNGSTWTQVPTAGVLPVARMNAHLVWDPIREKLVLYSGFDAGNLDRNDMWEFDGTTWTQRNQNGDPTYGLPLGRRQAGFAFDRARGVFVLHGGSYIGNTLQKLGDTWELAGNQWTFKRAEPNGARYGLYQYPHNTMGYDEQHEAMMMFTVPVNPLQNDTGIMFQWNGTDWQPKLTVGPHWRSGGARMAYDSERSRLFLAGGSWNAIEAPPIITWEWTYHDFEPTCGSVACGDGLIDPPEQCENTGPEDCCTDTCTYEPANTSCGSVACDGKCDGGAGCSCQQAICGNGEVETGETCDSECCPTCASYVLGSCGDPCYGDHCEVNLGGMGNCVEGDLSHGGCTAQSSKTKYVDQTGGSLETADHSVLVTIPPSTGSPQNYGIAANLSDSQFAVGTPETRVLVARLGPEGATFSPPGAAVTLRWSDGDANGIVDGTTIDERDLRIYKNGIDISGRCGAAPATCGSKCCKPAANEFAVSVTSFSEFVLVSVPPVCTTLAKPKLAIGKMLAPPNDDTLAFQGELALAASAPLDPVANGMRLALADTNGTIFDVTLPAGAYAKATKTGWKANKKLTSFSFARPGAGAPNGIFKAKVSRKKDVITVKASGKNATYAVVAPIHLTVTLDSGEPCADTRFDVGDQACALKSKGKALKCK